MGEILISSIQTDKGILEFQNFDQFCSDEFSGSTKFPNVNILLNKIMPHFASSGCFKRWKAKYFKDPH